MTGGLQTAASINHDHVWKSGAYYPFTQLMKYGRGLSLQASYEGDTFDIPGYAVDDVSQYATRTGIPYIDTAAAFDADKGELNIFALNRDSENDRSVEFDLSGFGAVSLVEHTELASADMSAYNTYENPHAVEPKVNTATVCKDGAVHADLKKLSWNVFRFKV
jgi:alpha-N-arabinofuranosidase